MAQLAKLPWAGFGPGTDKGRETRAKPEIWTEHAKFRELADNLGAETVKLAAAANRDLHDDGFDKDLTPWLI